MQFLAFTIGDVEKYERQSNAAGGGCLPICHLKLSASGIPGLAWNFSLGQSSSPVG